MKIVYLEMRFFVIESNHYPFLDGHYLTNLNPPSPVIPANAGIQFFLSLNNTWTPVFIGVTASCKTAFFNLQKGSFLLLSFLYFPISDRDWNSA